MAKSEIPSDILKSLEESGFSFDEDGKIQEEDFFNEEDLNEEDDLEEDQDDDQDDDDDLEEDSSEDDDEDDQDDDEDEDDEDEDEDDEDDEDDEKPLKLKPLKKSDDDDDPLKDMKKTQDELLARVRALAEKNQLQPDDDDDQEDDDASELKAEAQKFKQMRLQMFAKDVERDVNSLSLGAKFKDIIASEEWDTYLNSKAYGQTIKSLYVNSIKNNDSDDVVSFFTDFAERYLPSVASKTNVSKTAKKVKKKVEDKPSLDDLSVPSKAKANKTPVRKSKYDFKDTDYGDMLNKAERGKISFDDFVAFEDKFNKALKKGRVKTTD